MMTDNMILYLPHTLKKEKMQTVTKYNNFEVNNVTFSEPKMNKYGGKSVYLNYNGKPLFLQTPNLFLPYGLGEYDVKDSSGNPTGKKEYSLKLSFKGWEENAEVKDFLERMKAFNDTLITYGVQNSVKWFKKKHTREVVEALNSNVIQYSKDRETGEVNNTWPPTLKAKLYTRNDQFTCETYNTKKEQVDFRTNVVKGSYVRGLMSCTGVWFAGGKFGVTWVMKQMIVRPPNRLTGFSFILDEDDETYDDTNGKTATATTAGNQFVEDSDDDTEVDEEDGDEVEQQLTEIIQEEPVEKKKPRKKVTRKRKKKTDAATASL